MFIIEEDSNFHVDNLLIKNTKCGYVNCGGGLIVKNSKGTIKNSKFIGNIFMSYGGGLSIIDVSGNINILQSNFLNNYSMNYG